MAALINAVLIADKLSSGEDKKVAVITHFLKQEIFKIIKINNFTVMCLFAFVLFCNKFLFLKFSCLHKWQVWLQENSLACSFCIPSQGLFHYGRVRIRTGIAEVFIALVSHALQLMPFI